MIPDDERALEMTKYLIYTAKCKAGHADSLNQTALFYVARDGREDLAKIFIEQGCSANHIDSFGQTPIFYAAREGYRNLMKVLIEAGADPDHEDQEGQTPVFYAVKSGKLECVEYLLEECTVDLQRVDGKGMNLV